jgi:phosphoribosylformimino-5-aminoimidazole carboxamide ribotide isomerase
MPQNFIVIPVIDLKAGLVVHARAGQRELYRPISTPLSPSSEPHDILAGLLGLAEFGTVYAADLDAIGRVGDHRPVLETLARAHPVEFWVDAGVQTVAEAAAIPAPLVPVVGSESVRSIAELAQISERLGPDGFVLSLDYRGDQLVGPAGLDVLRDAWPARVIVMTLARVGSGSGPDFERLERILALADGRRVLAAGGVRGLYDLERLKLSGVAGALVATALHDGRLTREELAGFR